ncbi:MAG: ATP-binding protein, partial [Gammaproteobacteria bacterium]
MTQFQPQLGNAFYKALGAEDMEPLLAINEIIANSIDSWIEEYCGKKAKRPKLSIDINMSTKQITIQDNAGGMEPEELKNAMGFAKVQKELSDCADDLMGMYGFGLKAATANLGGHFEVVSKRKNKDLCHVVMPIDKMAQEVKAGKSGMLSDIEENGYNKKTKIKDVEKVFNPSKTKSGTFIYISQIKRPNFNPESIMNELCYAWHFFTQENHLGPAVEIKFNGVKIGEPEWGRDQGGQVPYSSIDFEFPFSWRENTETIDTKVQFSVWLNYKGGQYQAGGLSLYRKLQMVSYKDQELGKWWSNESASIEGYLSTNYLTPNQRKDDLDRTTRFYKEFNKALEPVMKGAAKLVDSQRGGLDGKGFSRTAMAQDEFEMGKFLALGWLKYFNEHPLLEVSSKFPKE